MTKFSLGALVAAGLLVGGLTAGSASAADLGGNCCADLEERIAELEATTARKGNRKVSLTVSGWVGQQVMWWDMDVADPGNNGAHSESNVYVTDLGSTLASHVKFTGQATISPGWYAGYVLHIEAVGSDSLTTDQSTPDGPSLYNQLGSGSDWGRGVQVVQSYWFVKSDQLGKVSVGLLSQASDNTAILVDGSGSLVPANWVAFDYRAFRTSGAGALNILGAASCGTMGGAVGDCNGLTQNSVRYDSPTFGGFSVSASWGEDDYWDVAARYAGEVAGFKVAAAAAYNEVKDPNYNNLGNFAGLGTDADYFQAGLYIQHVATGLFGLVNYGKYDDHTATTEQDTWYAKVGLRERWNPLGHTVLYGEYEHVEDAYQIAGNEFELWGGGVVQEIDAAAMSMFVKYRHIDAQTNAAGDTDTFQYVSGGALINF